MFIGVGMFACEWLGFAHGWIETGTTHCYWITLPVACTISIVILLLPRVKHIQKAMTFVSGISFEMYLVHSAMLGWTKSLTNNVIVYLVLFLTGTFVAGFAVNKISSGVRKLIGA